MLMEKKIHHSLSKFEQIKRGRWLLLLLWDSVEFHPQFITKGWITAAEVVKVVRLINPIIKTMVATAWKVEEIKYKAMFGTGWSQGRGV